MRQYIFGQRLTVPLLKLDAVGTRFKRQRKGYDTGRSAILLLSKSWNVTMGGSQQKVPRKYLINIPHDANISPTHTGTLPTSIQNRSALERFSFHMPLVVAI
jgi:hypothetical protein